MILGIEIGGTKLQLGVGSGTTPKLTHLDRCHVDAQRGARGILEQIETSAGNLLSRHHIERIGIGFGGPVSNGVVTKSHQIDGWENFPLAHWCREKFGIETVLGNDCDVAALAEASIGAGRGATTVFYATIGTGVGGGLVIDGRSHGHGRPAVAEIGHLRPGLDAISSKQTVESLASGPGIVNTAVRLGAMDASSAKQLADAAAAGDSLAAAALTEAVRALGWAIAQVITLVSPNVIVVGGGVSLIGEKHFFVPLRQQVERYVFPPLLGSYTIVPAALGEEAVVHGAIALASGK